MVGVQVFNPETLDSEWPQAAGSADSNEPAHHNDAWLKPSVEGLRFRFGTDPPVTAYIRVLLRAIYNHNIFIIQLLLRGGSTQGLGLRVSSLKDSALVVASRNSSKLLPRKPQTLSRGNLSP